MGRGSPKWYVAALPSDFPERINHALVITDREPTGHTSNNPSAAITDGRRIKSTESRGLRGYDAGKEIKTASGFLVDANRLVLHLVASRAVSSFHRAGSQFN